MATPSIESAPHEFRAIKLAIIGNSNSVMKEGYVRVLENTPEIIVKNRSIGSSPNVVLLDFLAREQDLDYDFIIIETAVVDFIQAGPLYSMERSLETLEMFVGYLRAASRARIIILTIPTRYGLLAPDRHWQESLYRNTAARLGIPILDGFQLVRQLVGQTAMDSVGQILSRAEELVAAFGLPKNLVPSIAWGGLRSGNVETNPFGVYAFVDHVHFAGAMHALLGLILANFITQSEPAQQGEWIRAALPGSLPVIASCPGAGSHVARTSGLMSRVLVQLRHGETTRYECPAGYRAYGLLVNQAKTDCFLQVVSPAGIVAFDMRFRPLPFDWIGIVVPIIDPIGNGAIEVTVLDRPPEATPCHQLHNTETKTGPGWAELGELIIVREDWRDHVSLFPDAGMTASYIQDSPWAQQAIIDAAARVASVVRGIEVDARVIPRDCSAYAAELLANGGAQLGFADQARLMVLLGMTDRLSGFLEAVLVRQAGIPDPELHDMRTVIAKLLPGSNSSARRPDLPPEPPAAIAEAPPADKSTVPVLTAADVAGQFESLGGGSLAANGWAFGCEFGFWQRSLGLEPLGLLRWGSISPRNLLRGLNAGFVGVEDETNLEMREHTGLDWGCTQTTYGIYLDHSHMARSEVSKQTARQRICKSLRFLREKLIQDLKSNEKLFVYRTYDHSLDDSAQAALADAVGRYGGSTLFYVQLSTSQHPAFTVERKSDNLIVGYIDHFAPRDGYLQYNPEGWETVCRAALEIWRTRPRPSSRSASTVEPTAEAHTGAPIAPVEGSGQDVRALVTRFESLGGHGHGCEFGLFQKHFGALPDGLLGWADIHQDKLSQALETEFAGIGEPQYTNIFVPENSPGPEYWTIDTRYHMAMRSFVSATDMPLDRMRLHVKERYKDLSRQLADDLRSGTKIFVYKNMKRNLTEIELLRLRAACRRYGENTLFYIRYEDAEHPNGTVSVAADGLMIGYIDHFSHAPDTDEHLGPAHSSLLALCKTAFALWNDVEQIPLAGHPIAQAQYPHTVKEEVTC